MILCYLAIPQKGTRELVKIDDKGNGKEVIDNIFENLEIYEQSRSGILVSVKKKGIVNPELSLYKQGMRNGDTLIFIFLEQKEIINANYGGV